MLDDVIYVSYLGLSELERDLIESNFKNGIISVLTATSTLAAGVNLPAGRVLIKSMYIGKDILNVIQNHQMCGRAGRTGHTNFGESYLLVKVNEKNNAILLCNKELPPVTSQMRPPLDGGRGLLKVLLELFSLGLCQKAYDVQKYLYYTLMYQEEEKFINISDMMIDMNPNSIVIKEGMAALSFLLSAKALEYLNITQNIHQADNNKKLFIKCTNNESVHPSKQVSELRIIHSMANNNNNSNHTNNQSLAISDHIDLNADIRISRFGRAVISSGMNPDEAISLYEDLLRAQDQLNLETELHLIYLVTPLQHPLIPNFQKLFHIIEKSKYKNIPIFNTLNAIGIDESLVFKWTHQPPSYDTITSSTDKLRLLRIKVNITKDHDENKSIRNHAQLSEYEITILARCRRLWAALALRNIIEDGHPRELIAQEYSVSLGDIQSLLKSSRMLAQKIQRFSGEIGWPSLEKLMLNFNDKLDIDIPSTLRDLMSIPILSLRVAKVLQANNIERLTDLCTLSSDRLVHMLSLSLAFQINVIF